jgi:hypothetical protein
MLEGWLGRMALQVPQDLPDHRGTKVYKETKAYKETRVFQGLMEHQVLLAMSGLLALQERKVLPVQASAMETQKATSSTGTEVGGRTWL